MEKNRIKPFLNWFAGIFLILAIVGYFQLLMLILGVAIMLISHHCQLIVDQHFVTAYDGLIKKWRVIIEKKNIRITDGRRTFGSCWIIDDQSSTQEIVLYRWMFTKDQVNRFKSLL